jgi:MFS family permease
MPTLRRTFRSLHTRNYRLFYVGQLTSLSGTWCQNVALSWLVWSITGSGVALGAVTALQFLPILVLGAWTGLLADRVEKRRLLIASNLFLGGVAAALAVLTLTGVVQVWHLYALSLLGGVGTALEIPSRQSFVNELVGPDDLANAIGLNSALYNASRVIGPGLAGVLIGIVGSGWCFVINVVSFAAVIEAYRRMRSEDMYVDDTADARGKGQVRQGIVVAWRTPVLRRTILVVGIFSFTAFNFQVLLPVLAERSYGGGSGLFSVLTAGMGVGSVAGALLVASRHRPSDEALLVAGVLSGLLLVAASLTTVLVIVIPLLVIAGGTTIAFLSTANARVQLEAPADVRGRVIALYALVFLGSTPVAGPGIGWVAERFGAQVALGGGGAAATVVIAAMLLPSILRGRSTVAGRRPTAVEAATALEAASEQAADGALSPASPLQPLRRSESASA